MIDEESELERDYAKLRRGYENLDEFNLVLYRVFLAARSLRNSGYDGPFIGEVTGDLFGRIAEVEKFIKGD